MNEDIRYKIEHFGDFFVDALSCVVDFAEKSAKGIVLSYDIRGLKKKKQECLGGIGRRIVEVKEAGLTDLNTDDTLLRLIADAEKIDRYIESYEEEKRQARHGCNRKVTHAADPMP